MKTEAVAYCRLCADEKPYGNLTDLQGDDHKRREIVSKLHRVNTTIDLSNDYPKTVCFVCIDALECAYNFVLAVETAQAALGNKIDVQRIKEETASTDRESFVYEPPDIKSEGEHYDDVKIEPVETETSLENPQMNSEPTKECNNYLEEIPLTHLKITWEDYVWMCAICEMRLPTHEELISHSMQYHKCCNAFLCIDCNQRKLCLKKFLTHIRRHTNDLNLSCHKCFMTFQNVNEMHLHTTTHITSKYVCLGCNTSFTNSLVLNKHKREYYQGRQGKTLSNLSDVTSLVCQESLTNKSELSAHMQLHSDRDCKHICNICGRSFTNKKKLNHHMTLHSDVRPYKCEICKLQVKSITILRQHISTHDATKPFVCEQCGKCFRLEKQLNVHKIIHTDSLPYVCSYCNKGFKFKPLLTQHIRLHTGEKPYSCNVCNRDFTNWPNYNKHMKRLHNIETAKKKYTSEGPFPVNPKSKELVKNADIGQNLEEWKLKTMQPWKKVRGDITKNTEEMQNENPK